MRDFTSKDLHNATFTFTSIMHFMTTNKGLQLLLNLQQTKHSLKSTTNTI